MFSEWMFSFRRSVLLLAAAGMTAGLALGQPALTTIQDILYRADGSRFNGTMFVRWNSFLAGDTSNIATSNLTLPIVNGVLSVRLVPTTTASAGAQYSVTYKSGGQTQFTETWAVPPSALRLRVRDVRLSSGTSSDRPPWFHRFRSGMLWVCRMRCRFAPRRASVSESDGRRSSTRPVRSTPPRDVWAIAFAWMEVRARAEGPPAESYPCFPTRSRRSGQSTASIRRSRCSMRLRQSTA